MTNSHAGFYKLVSAHKVVRGTGAPVKDTFSFAARDTVAEYSFNVYNGGLEGYGIVGGLVSSSTIKLNGKVKFSPNEFNQTVTFLTKQVNVNSSNTIEVSLKGKPGGILVIDVVGEDNDPPIIKAFVSPVANAAGWQNKQVVVSYECDDLASGVAFCPAAVTVNVEAAGQIITGTARDIAGNEATATVTLNIDQTPPVVTSTALPLPNINNWNKTSVTISYSCQDSLSGIASCSPPVTLSLEGKNQIVTGQGMDVADNVADTSHTVNIDLTAPIITSSLSIPANLANWHKNDVSIIYQCSDALSGIVNCPATKLVSTEAKDLVITALTADRADNTTSSAVTISLDKTNPIITTTAVPLPNAKDWNKTPVTVSFDCQDSLSGVANCEAPVTLSTEGASQIITGQGSDIADNSTSVTHKLNIDLTQPTIASAMSTPANTAGWHNNNLTVSYTCADALSGVVDCPADNTLITEGKDQIIVANVADNADNTNSTSVSLSLDKTNPSLTSTAVPLPNVKDWNKTPVTISFDCQDTLSGVATCAAPVILSTEGASQIITGQGSDIADNSASVTHKLNIDLTQPTIASALSTPANTAGWHNNDLTVSYTCADALSGVVDCPAANVLLTEGKDQIISASVVDNADNANNTSVTLNLDKTAPVVTSTPAPMPNANGWHKTAVTVNFDCQDTLSGIANCTAPVAVSAEGANQIIAGQGNDLADNTTSITQLLNIDLTVPTISAQLSTQANAAGWHNNDLIISYTCLDTLSDIAICPAANSFLTEGKNQIITASVADKADNTSEISVTLNLDKIPPTINATSEPLPNINGWNKSPVTVNFDCNDTLSGIKNCSLPASVIAEGENQNVVGQTVDIADNTAQVTKILNIDLTAPTITTQFSANANGAGWHNTPVTLSFTCNDLLSSIQTCPDAITISNDIQGQIVNVTAADMADNTVSQQHTIHLDTTAPQIVFVTPATGVELASLQPVIELNITDNMIINEASFALSVNGSAFPGQCVINAASVICTPTSNLPRGAIHLQATVSDVADNSTTSTHDFKIQEDRDGDGVPDVDDVFPDDSSEWVDLDGDGIGDNSDPDVDGDGINNDYETQAGTNPRDPASVPPDLDTDGIPDSLDDDLDGDGVLNTDDVFPNDPTESSDLDGDGIGDNSDPDRDGDGFTNEEEILNGSSPDNVNDVPGNLFIAFSATSSSTTVNQFIDLSGNVYGEIIDRVYLTSDRLAGTNFSATVANKTWSSRIALRVGENIIRAHVEGNRGKFADSANSITITRTEPAPVVGLVFDSPANNSLVTTADVVVSGHVSSETVIELPQVTVNNIAASVKQSSTPTEFTFTANLTLQEGSNIITASTILAGQTIQKTLTLNYQLASVEVLPPIVGISSPQPGKTLNTDSFVLSTIVQSAAGLSTLTINGQPATLSTSNQIEKTLSFAGQSQLDVVIVATDNLNQVSTLNASYTLDNTAPIIQVDTLQVYPTENTVTENPYNITGTVTDATLLQLTLNDQVLTLEPTATQNSYRFNASLTVPVGTVSSINLSAIDAAGNQNSSEYLLTANSNIQIEWITPDDNSQIVLENSGQLLDVSARLSDITGIGNVQVEIVGQTTTPVVLSLDTDIASGQIILPEAEGEHSLRISVLNSVGEVLTNSTRSLQLNLAQALPLTIIQLTPADEAIDVEPNGFAAAFFNKVIDLNLLNIEVFETVHGFSYIDVDPPGLNALNAKGYVLQEVNSDYAAVPGVFSLLPNNTIAVFYPQRDLAYNADIYLIVSYDGEEMARRHFKVRPRPTFIEGMVIDNLAQPISGVEVHIAELDRTTTTDKDGGYSFGYGDSAAQNITKGQYHLVANAGLKDRRFGSYKTNINIQGGTQNPINNIALPLLNKDIAFSYITSGTINVINGGEVSLDASNASYLFDNSREEGTIHLQFLPFSSIKQQAFKGDYTPIWAYGIQPAGITVQGELQIEFTLPKYQGSYDYAPVEGELVVLMGNSADNTRLIPVGVGEALASHRIKSVGATHWQVLDIIAYARITFEQRADLEAYKNGDIDIQNLNLRLQSYTYIPPANEAEALERFKTLAQ